MSTNSETLVHVREAVAKARSYLSEIMQVPAEQLLLEEIEPSEDDHFWMVTFSYAPPAGSSLAEAIRGKVYKTVKIDAVTGDFESVKIRTL